MGWITYVTNARTSRGEERGREGKGGRGVSIKRAMTMSENGSERVKKMFGIGAVSPSQSRRLTAPIDDVTAYRALDLEDTHPDRSDVVLQASDHALYRKKEERQTC